MEIIKTKKLEIINVNKSILNDTIDYYNSALKFIIPIIENHYNDTLNVDDRMKIIENLIHSTEKNQAKYTDFDSLFFKMPSYFRRSLIQDGIGILDSHISRMNNWLNEKLKFEEKIKNNKTSLNNTQKKNNKERKFNKLPPLLQYEPNNFPSFYDKNMFMTRYNDGKGIISKNMGIYLKVFKNNDWKWIEIQIKDNNSKNYNDFFNTWKSMNPTLVKKSKYNKSKNINQNNINQNMIINTNNSNIKGTETVSNDTKNDKFYLHIPYKTNIKLKEKNDKKIRICSIDLGLNTDATCVIMNNEGTVLAKKFINLAREKDRIYRIMNKLKKLKRNSGSHPNFHIYTKLNNLKTEYINKLTNKIIEFSLKYDIDVIVMEHLGKMKGSGKIKEKLHNWAKINLFNKIKSKSHINKIRIARINPNGTSKYAFDGSGEIIRGKLANDYLPENILLKENLENNIILNKDNKSLTKSEKEIYYNKNKIIKIQNYSYGIFSNGKIYNIDLNAAYNIAARYFYNIKIKTLTEKKRLIIEAKVPELLKRTTFSLSSLMSLNNFDYKLAKVS